MKNSLYINAPAPVPATEPAHPKSWRCECGAVVPWERDRHYHYDAGSIYDVVPGSEVDPNSTVAVQVYFRPRAEEVVALDRPPPDAHLQWLPPDWSAPREGEKD